MCANVGFIGCSGWWLYKKFPCVNTIVFVSNSPKNTTGWKLIFYVFCFLIIIAYKYSGEFYACDLWLFSVKQQWFVELGKTWSGEKIKINVRYLGGGGK